MAYTVLRTKEDIAAHFADGYDINFISAFVDDDHLKRSLAKHHSTRDVAFVPPLTLREWLDLERHRLAYWGA